MNIPTLPDNENDNWINKLEGVPNNIVHCDNNPITQDHEHIQT